MHDCYKTPPEYTMFDFHNEWNDWRGGEGLSIFGGRKWHSYVNADASDVLFDTLGYADEREFEYVGHKDADELAVWLSNRCGEEYIAREIHGCCQGEWAIAVLPKAQETELPYIEQEYFNYCEEWRCVPDGDEDCQFFCFTYPFITTDTEEQLRKITCDDVTIHECMLVRTWVWD